MSPPKLVVDLVERFDRDRKVFLSPDYKEEQLRAEFVLHSYIRHSDFVIRSLPHEFSVLPADILGQVYEQFLGKVIRLTAGHMHVAGIGATFKRERRPPLHQRRPDHADLG